MYARQSTGLLWNGLTEGRISLDALRKIQTLVYPMDTSHQVEPPRGVQPNAATTPSQSSIESQQSEQRQPQSRSYHLAITLVHTNPSALTVEWDAQEKCMQFMEPFIKNVSSLMDISISTQMLHYASITTKPKFDQQHNHFVLREENFAEFVSIPSLQQSAPSGHSTRINLLLYVPAPSEQPFVLKQKSGHLVPHNSFLIPKWGAVSIIQPSRHAKTGDVFVVSIEEMMPLFFPQIKSLLGLGSEPSMCPHTMCASNTLEEWEVAKAKRLFAVQNIRNAIDSLRGINNLIERIPNMIVDDSMQFKIEQSVSFVETSLATARKKHSVNNTVVSSEIKFDFIKASDFTDVDEEATVGAATIVDVVFMLTQKASDLAESAFYDPNMLALLYFPEDEKYAVYVPFLIPAVASVFMTWLKNGPLKY